MFVTKKDRTGLRLAITVLTRDMAAVNMEAALPVTMAERRKVPAVRAESPAPFVGGLVGEGPPVPVRKPKPQKAFDWTVTVLQLFTATDAELASMESHATGPMKHIIQREQGQRRRVTKMAEHARRMEYHRQAMKKVMLRMIPESQHADAFRALEEEERAMGLRHD